MCGILGITSQNPVVQDLYDGLMVIQHRGQDAAGILTYSDRFHLKKGSGLAKDVFRLEHLIKLQGNIGIAHVRYATAGCYDASEAQPFITNVPFGIALIHNGNLTNYEELKADVTKGKRWYINTTSDSELLLLTIANELLKLHTKDFTPHILFRALENAYKKLKGSYSVICLIADYGLLAFRDPRGIRPLCFGKRKVTIGEEFIFASESVALDTLGFEFERDVKPGEAIFIDMKGKVHAKQIEETKWAPCLFEWVYLARPDSFLDKVSVHKARLRLGEFLAQKIQKAMKNGVKIDVIIPVPDSARVSAQAISSATGIRYREGLVKNRYIGRTFIMPDQGIRKRSIKYKLNAIPLEIRRKNVLLVDDSVVRGNTSRKIIEMVRDAGAKKVYFASSAPPLRHPCVYGVDMPSRKDFVAHNLSEDEVAKAIGADGVFYQDLKDLITSVKAGNPKITGFCHACFSGKYPTPDVTEEVLKRMEDSRVGIESEENQNGDSQLTLL